jgi:hypothetical protein
MVGVCVYVVYLVAICARRNAPDQHVRWFVALGVVEQLDTHCVQRQIAKCVKASNTCEHISIYVIICTSYVLHVQMYHLPVRDHVCA